MSFFVKGSLSSFLTGSRYGIKCAFRTFYVSCASAGKASDEQELEPLVLTNDVGRGIRRLTLNSVKKRNSLSLAMLEELEKCFYNSSGDSSVRVIILSHSGPVFSAGHNLKELQTSTGSEFHKQVFEKCADVMKYVQDMRVPVIAEVNGVATAAGCQLVASCDLAVASSKSTFATPGVLIGLFCSTPGVAVARAMHRKHALKMLLTGEPISAQDALNFGLINEAVPEEKLQQTSEALAHTISAHSAPVISLGKRSFYEQIGMSRNDAYDLASNRMVENLKLNDSQEGISAFFEKRKPLWEL